MKIVTWHVTHDGRASSKTNHFCSICPPGRSPLRDGVEPEAVKGEGTILKFLYRDLGTSDHMHFLQT